MDYNTALRVLEREVVVPTFFARLAEHGVVPHTPEEARSWLVYGASLHKKASQRPGFGLPKKEALSAFVKKAWSFDSPLVRRAVKVIVGQ